MSSTIIPSEYELELSAERSKRLRRRFMWFCGINLALAMLQVPSFRTMLRQSIGANQIEVPRLATLISVGFFIPTFLIYLCAFLYAWIRKPRGRTMVLLALWLTIVVYSIGLIGSRIGFQITAPIIRNQIIRNFDRDITEANARRAATRPSTAPAGTS